MPFDVSGATGTSPSTSTLRVEPDQVLRLKAELQLIHTEVERFLYDKGRGMVLQPLGADPVSHETATALNENTQSALEAAFGYLSGLQGVLNALDQAVRTYNLAEDTNGQAFLQGTR